MLGAGGGGGGGEGAGEGGSRLAVLPETDKEETDRVNQHNHKAGGRERNPTLLYQ